MTVSAHDVARELRARLPNAGVVKLHKLLYYAQGWHLAFTGEPLFDEAVEAWTNGPVVGSLWADEKHDLGTPEATSLEGEQYASLDYVVERYGHLSGKDLIRMTHDEAPWRDVSESDDPFAFPNPEITHDALRSWFRDNDEYVQHAQAAERLGRRDDVYSFEPLARTEDLEAAVARARRGEKVRQTRPS